MLLSKEYVAYLAREVTKKLIAGGTIETKSAPLVTEKIHAAMLVVVVFPWVPAMTRESLPRMNSS